MTALFIDGNPLHARELRGLVPELEFELASLPASFSASSPEPGARARDKLLALGASSPQACFADAVDLVSPDGKSLRLELDTGNYNRFCKWWREKPVRLVLCTATRVAGSEHVEVHEAICEGRIAEKPVGLSELGWERVFVPVDEDETLAELTRTGFVLPFREAAWRSIATRLSATP